MVPVSGVRAREASSRVRLMPPQFVRLRDSNKTLRSFVERFWRKRRSYALASARLLAVRRAAKGFAEVIGEGLLPAAPDTRSASSAAFSIE